MCSLWNCCFVRSPQRVSLNHKNPSKSKNLCLLLLGPSQTGKTKLLDTLSDSNEVHAFPSPANQLEEAKSSLSYLGREVPVLLTAISDSSTQLLLVAYINNASIVLLMYDKKNLEHLRQIQKKYLPLLLKHREHSTLWIIFVGTTTKNNPYTEPYQPSFVEKKLHDFTLRNVLGNFSKKVSTRVAGLDVIVDDHESVLAFKAELTTHVLINRESLQGTQMHLRISNHDTNQFKVEETENGTYIYLKQKGRRLKLAGVSPFSGVSLCTSSDTIGELKEKENSTSLFFPCKFSQLRVEGQYTKVLLSGIKSEHYSVSIDGCNNAVIFTDESNVGCVNWEETGSSNILDVSQQENTHTSGNFSPTTNVITKTYILPQCKICYGDVSANVLIHPCGHLGLCEGCARKHFTGQRKVCPFCRRPAERLQTLYVV